MRDPLRLRNILLLSIVLSGIAQGQHIFVMGVSEPNTCAFATTPLIQDLNGLGFPKDWTFAVACTQAAWEELQRKGNAFGTSTAFTNVRGRITILNGTIYLESLPLRGTTHPTPRMVLWHEYGHFVCQCGDESKADRAAGLSNAARLSEFLGRENGSYPGKPGRPQQSSHRVHRTLDLPAIAAMLSPDEATAIATGLNSNTTTQSIEDRSDPDSLRKRAEQGDAKAAYVLAQSYMTGSGVPQNYREAAKWCRQAAAQNLVGAQFLLGFLYEHGDGVARDYKTALSYYTAAAMQGYATAQNNLAMMYELGRGTKRNVIEAERWYRAAAEQSAGPAQCNLASLEFRQRNYQQAIVWFREAAQHGSATAQEDLAWMYFTGTGAPLNYSEAAKWVRLAAEHGFSRAQLDLGFLYEQGKGVPLDYISAYVWYKAAEDGGQKRAGAQLKSLSLVMTREQISAATEKAATVPRSLSEMDETESPIGRPFGDTR